MVREQYGRAQQSRHRVQRPTAGHCPTETKREKRDPHHGQQRG